jgi:hypothetical protein
VWLHNRGIVLEGEKRRLGSPWSESVAAYCRRAVQLQPDIAIAIERLMTCLWLKKCSRLERGRPEWAVLQQGLQGRHSGREAVHAIQPDLVRLEGKMKKSNGRLPRTPCRAGAPPTQDAPFPFIKHGFNHGHQSATSRFAFARSDCS